MERREIFGPKVRAVVPNSRIIAGQLRKYYPEAAANLADPIPPGVAPSPVRPSRAVPGDGGIVGFVGYEWRRKGLEMAVRIASGLARTRPKVEFWVAGPDPGEVRHLFRGFPGVHRLLGKTETSSLYPELDVLLHPAIREPYGMVVAEAMAAKVRVVISDACGVAESVTESHGAVLSLGDPPEEWIAACGKALDRSGPMPGYDRPWSLVALEYERLYRSLSNMM
jgi:UDP-glucose:(heptosyl)LPS alpha-1,3-glucosyltransferase